MPSTDPNAIRCRNLVKRYPPDVIAVDGLDLEIARGECFGLLGPNGAGKTTTVEILEGLLAPTSGEVEVLGERWGRDDRALRQRLGITLQETVLPEKLSVREILTLFRSFYVRGPAPDEAIALVGLQEKASARIGKLSGGQKQRLAVACALVGEPEVLFLDEPTTGLDPQSRRSLWDVLAGLRAAGRTILLTTHYMEEAERLCDRVAVIDHGKVIALGRPSDLIASLGAEHVIEAGVGEDGGAAGAGGNDGAAAAGALSDDAVRALPGVTALRRENGGLVLTVTGPHLTLPPLLQLLASGGRQLTALRIRHATLEDVFVKLTGRHLRDDAAA